MPSPIELALTSLLPTQSHLAGELIDLATSLVAQSRYKASTLKPDEEIGRTYACCQIACETLRKRLALEISKPSPPCPPRVYNKLLKFLQSVLSTRTSTTTPATPSRTSRVAGRGAIESDVNGDGGGQGGIETPRSRKSLGATKTPTRRNHGDVSAAVTPSASTRKRALDDVVDGVSSDAVMALIRVICKALGEPKAAPHVFVGADVLSITANLVADDQGVEVARASPAAKRRATGRAKSFRSNGDEKNNGELSERLRALARLIAVCVLVTLRIHDSEDSDEARQEMKQQCELAVDAVAVSQWAQNKGLEDKKQELSSAAEVSIDSIHDESNQADWYTSIPRTGSADVLEAESEPLRTTRNAKTPLRRKEKHARRPPAEDGFEDAGNAGLLPGLGTMFQTAVDWLSDERLQELNKWKRNIRRQIAIAEQAS